MAEAHLSHQVHCMREYVQYHHDGGSCENVVSTQMVKLSLNTQRHSQPYLLTWLKKGNEICVDYRCLVDFFIGDKLQDQVWCDIVPMDTCHILLGRF